MRTVLATLALGGLLVAAAAAQTAPPAARDDPFAGRLFAPEEIIRHQTAIALSQEQRRTLIGEVTRAQAEFLPAQMELAEHAEELKRLLDRPRVDEAAALAAAGRVMELEARIKQRHLALAIRLKNLLEESQQARLLALRESG